MKSTYSYKINSWGISRFQRTPKRSYTDDAVRGFSELKQKSKLNRGFRHNSQISKNSRKKIIERVRLLAHFANEKTYRSKKGNLISFKIQMVTLTFKFHVDEKKSKKLLNIWLTNMRTTYGMQNYVWRMELQTRGVIHFHIVTDCDLTMDITHKTWNQILVKNGYPNAMDWNSTDVKRFNSASSYIAKYAGKDEKIDSSGLTGRLWGSSRELNFKYISENLSEAAEFIYWFFVSRGVMFSNGRRRVEVRISDYCEFILVPFEVTLNQIHRLTSYIREQSRTFTPFPSTCTWYDLDLETLFSIQDYQTELDF